MVRKIVFPDAEESLAPMFKGPRLSKLEELGEFIIYYGNQPDDETFIHRIADANAVISGWGLSNTVLAALPNLEIISFTGLGVSTFIDLAETTRRNITVTHTLSTSETIAEHTMGLMLDAARHISRLDRDIRKGFWNTELVGLDLRGKTLGLVGFGRIAQAVVPLAQAFGMKVISWTRNPDKQRAAQCNIKFMELDHLLASSDVVSLHLSLTPETERLINADRLRLLKPGALIVNTARSKIIDGRAFIESLRSGHIGAAGIDVFDDEPIYSNHPLIEFDNVVMTPHVAYNTPEALEEMFDTAIQNLVAFYSGRPQNVAPNSEA
jgi:phosphoglycerate dehydrogenase-like enzyme